MDTFLTCCSSSRCVAPAIANPRTLRRLLQSCAPSSASCSSSCTGLLLQQQQQLAAIVAVQQQRQHCGTRSSNCSTSHESVGVEEDEEEGFSRRGFLGCLVAVPLLLQQSLVCCSSNERGAAGAAETTTTQQQQQQYRKYVDRLDGYEFNYPAGWIQVRGAGADVFFRDPVNLDENVLVEISSPSSSKFKGVQDLGSPEQAGKKVLRQYLTEFMSTRLGVRRESNIVATGSRLGDDGRLYYDVEVNVSSYANNNQLAVMPQDRVAQLEWSRRYLSVLGVENSRLYELRLQVPEGAMEREEKDLRGIMDSFRVLKLEA
jgi:hypothetical protein